MHLFQIQFWEQECNFISDFWDSFWTFYFNFSSTSLSDGPSWRNLLDPFQLVNDPDAYTLSSLLNESASPFTTWGGEIHLHTP